MTIGSQPYDKISLAIGATLMLGAGQSAFAHTIIQNNLLSEVPGYSATYITHGCLTHLPTPLPIVAESVVIPTINPILGRSDGGPITSLGDFFTKNASHASTAQVPVTSLAGLFTLQQTRDLFTSQTQLHDGPTSGGNVIGWVSTRGNLHLNQFGATPFRFAGISFAQNTCARSLKITFADATICDVNNFKTDSGPTDPSTVNLWLDNTYLHFHGVPIENGAATPVLTINRDTSLKPYPANCQGAGGADPLFDVTIKPSQADVELLQFPGWGGPGTSDPSYYY